MEVEACLAQFMGETVLPQVMSAPLPDAVAAAVVERLKQEADRHWGINPHRSLELAERIVAIGRARGDARQTALGLMARGDALKLVGHMPEAWDMLEQAGSMFEAAGDEVGWARTRIGRLYLSTKLNCVPAALEDAEHARAIFTRYGEHEKLLRLDWQTALVYNHLGDQHLALELFGAALAIADQLGEAGQPYLGPLYTNVGLTHFALGDFHQALAYYERARALMVARRDTLEVARVEANIAHLAQAQGQYRRALTLLHSVLEQVADESPFEAAMTRQHIVECYLSLNRYAEARDFAQQVIQNCREFKAAYDLARTLLNLAAAEAALANYTVARAALAEAEPIFTSLGATTWLATIRLWRGRMALKQSDAATALQEAVVAAACFQTDGQHVNDATATLLQGQALFALGEWWAAAEAGHKALRVAQRYNVPSLRYAAHLLLGQIADAQNARTRAIRCYQAAGATIERVQRGLTITLRPGFLEDKGEALRALIALHLRAGDATSAFEALERAKSQVWLGYLANREDLRWVQEDGPSRALIEELNRLRAEHHWFYRRVHDSPRSADHPSVLSAEQALAEVAVRERRMRAITEQLYLRSGGSQWANHAPALSLREIQQTLDEETQLIEYYHDGEHLWAFTLDRQSVRAHRLPLTTETLRQLIPQLQANLAAALKVNPEAPAARNLTHLARRILQRLHALLVEPLALRPRDGQRLVIVPYGALHFLPFHLLHDGSAHLIERCEVVTLPAAGLAARPGPKRAPGALILTHSWEGRLPHTRTEAQIVQRLFGGRVCADEAANRSALQASPTQILHIAAHGQHRLDQPDLSYLQLADGQLYADDLMQQDLSYELVTLSACETGRANVAADEELIGIGRGFLYAGAGALILSLWGVADAVTVDLMEGMYSALGVGASKAAALREAQRAMLAADRELHPAFWGAFQLIGDARPLSASADR